MAFRHLLTPLLTPLRSSPFALGLTLTGAYAATSLLRPSRSRLLYCDAGPVGSVDSTPRYPSPASSRVSNARTYRQISSGSIAGLVAGLAVSTFSKTLALLFGLLVFGVQVAASRGINVIPYGRIQRYLGGINLRSALEENPAFKLSFGATFALAAFAPL